MLEGSDSAASRPITLQVMMEAFTPDFVELNMPQQDAAATVVLNAAFGNHALTTGGPTAISKSLAPDGGHGTSPDHLPAVFASCNMSRESVVLLLHLAIPHASDCSSLAPTKQNNIPATSDLRVPGSMWHEECTRLISACHVAELSLSVAQSEHTEGL